MTREEWQIQLMILTHEETDAEHYSAALHRLEDHDATQRAALAEKEDEIAELTKKVMNLTAWYDKMFGTPCEEIRHEQQLEQLQADLDRVIGEAVWAMRLVLLDNPEGCSAWCNAMEFLNSPLVQSYQARQEET